MDIPHAVNANFGAATGEPTVVDDEAAALALERGIQSTVLVVVQVAGTAAASFGELRRVGDERGPRRRVEATRSR